MPTGEQILGVIPSAQIKTGMFSKKTYTLVVTNTRLLFAELTNDALKGAIEEARAAKKAAGGGFFGQWGAQMGVALHFAERYLALDPETILAETTGNFAISPSEVKSIKVERKTEHGNDDNAMDRDYLRLTIEAQGNKREFNTEGENPRVNDARALLATTFGQLVR